MENNEDGYLLRRLASILIIDALQNVIGGNKYSGDSREFLSGLDQTWCLGVLEVSEGLVINGVKEILTGDRSPGITHNSRHFKAHPLDNLTIKDVHHHGKVRLEHGGYLV